MTQLLFMFCFLLSTLLLASVPTTTDIIILNGQESKKLELKNQFSFFSQDVRGAIALPITLSPRQNLNLEIQVPSDIKDPGLRKVFNADIAFQDLTAKLEVFYFLQKGENYLSQQITFLKGKEILARCSSYFPLTQSFLVPGACGGGKDGTLWGISFFKAP